MREVNVSDLRTHLPEYLARAEGGEEILVTRHGRVIARLIAARDKRADARAQLAALRGKARVGDVISPVESEWEADR
jgi:prevent-host-death family protein